MEFPSPRAHTLPYPTSAPSTRAPRPRRPTTAPAAAYPMTLPAAGALAGTPETSRYRRFLEQLQSALWRQGPPGDAAAEAAAAAGGAPPAQAAERR